jgi:ATP-dependent Clp protease ATP-binding subunit ClpA
MALERFTQDVRAVVLAASQEEARACGSATVEAEHLLLALTVHPSLQHLGLDHDQIEQALSQEEERSLASVGMADADVEPPTALAMPPRPKLATSAKLALQRSLTVARRRGDRRIQTHHLLYGVLAADHGRVPRALQIAGIDVEELRTRL